MEDRRQFFSQHKQSGRFGQRLVLAMQLTLQFLDPSPILPGLRGAARPRFAEAGDRIALPGLQLRRIPPLLAPPGPPRPPILSRCADPRLHPPRRCPALAAAASGSIGQGIRPPAFQRRHADPDLTRHQVDRRTLWRQQSRHYPIFVRLSVSCHFLLSAPPKVPNLSSSLSDLSFWCNFHASSAPFSA